MLPRGNAVTRAKSTVMLDSFINSICRSVKEMGVCERDRRGGGRRRRGDGTWLWKEESGGRRGGRAAIN